MVTLGSNKQVVL